MQTFSLGFGPALPGCSFRYGETTYKIAILPLGGYVQMVGEGADADEDENYPRSYKNKTVLQRMLIISAGVFMNVLLGCVCFVVVYQFHGVPMPPAAVWRMDAGSPAWKAGIPTGAVFTEIGGTRNPNFETLKEAVALILVERLSSHGVPDARRPESVENDAALRPRRDAGDSQAGHRRVAARPSSRCRRQELRRLRRPRRSTTPPRRRPASWTLCPATW